MLVILRISPECDDEIDTDGLYMELCNTVPPKILLTKNRITKVDD